MNDVKKLLGKRIKSLRKYKQMSQEQLSELANIDSRSLSHIECGDTFPSRSLIDIANALNVNLPDLFDFEHVEITRNNMCDYIKSNVEYLNDKDVSTVYRLIKSLR